jgi:hypothetical protein
MQLEAALPLLKFLGDFVRKNRPIRFVLGELQRDFLNVFVAVIFPFI